MIVSFAAIDWPTWLALVFGGVGAFAAARGLALQTSEHRRLVHELEKRADFMITIRPVGAPGLVVGEDSATYTTPATAANLRFEIGIRNIGARAATHVTLNFLGQDRHANLVWCGPNGEPMPGAPAAETSERLSSEPSVAATRFLVREFDRIAVRTPRLAYAVLEVDVPMNGTSDLHVRAKVQSDDLPDDVVERVKDFVVQIIHGSPPHGLSHKRGHALSTLSLRIVTRSLVLAVGAEPRARHRRRRSRLRGSDQALLRARCPARSQVGQLPWCH